MSIFYDSDAILKLITWILIPIFVAIITFALGLLFYSMGSENREETKYNRAMTIWSSGLAILISALLVGMSVGFGLSFTDLLNQYELTPVYKLVYYFYLILPIVPFGFLIYFAINFIKAYRLDKEAAVEDKIEEVIKPVADFVDTLEEEETI